MCTEKSASEAENLEIYPETLEIYPKTWKFTGRRAGDLGRWQALDKGEVRPAPAFRLLRVGAELYVPELWGARLSGEYCIFRTDKITNF